MPSPNGSELCGNCYHEARTTRAALSLEMIPLSVGIDLVDVPRIKAMLDRYGGRVMQKLLTVSERAYCEPKAYPEQHVAARVAAKEAAYKALQADGKARSVSWLDIEVVVEATGRPSLRFLGRGQAAASRLGVKSTLVSLTHVPPMAAAVVVLVGGD